MIVESEELKCVMIMDNSLPHGIIANAAAIMGITVGKYMPSVVGQTVTDKDGREHLGVIEFPVPILAGSKECIKALRQKIYDKHFNDIIVVDFSDLAQGRKTYSEYIEKMSVTPESALSYFGIAMCGNKKKINALTGNLPLLK